MHAQRTLQPPQFTSKYPSPAHGQAGPREDDGPVLRFGFTFQHVEALARRAVRDHSQSRGRDWEDRYEAAWGAAVERLYSADEPVSALDLLQAATRGLRRMAQAYLRDRGYAWSRSGGGISATPSFWGYWSSPESASPEETVVDLEALEQVMARLSPSQAAALRALAEHGSHQAAAEALGVSPSALDNRLGRARSAFLALWHEHEAPSRKWRGDSPAFQRGRGVHPATPAEEAATLATVAEAFGGRARMPGRDLLAALAAADSAWFGNWNPYDLAGFLRRHQVSRHRIEAREDGRVRWFQGYWLEEVTAALDHLRSQGLPDPVGEAETVTAAA